MTEHRQIFKIFAILALLMHLMAQITPLWLPKNGNTIQICTSQGIEVVTLNENGEKIPAPAMPKHDCPFCLAQTTTPFSAATIGILAPNTRPYLKSNKTGHGIVLPASHLTLANQTRGPPAITLKS